MTVFLTLTDIQETTGNVPSIPGAAPSSTAGMQGNPSAAQYQPHGTYPGVPISGGAGQVLGTPEVSNLIATGNIPLQAQPTTVGGAPGLDSLMAQMSRGQLSRNQTNYGQGGFMPYNAGNSPQAPQSGSVTVNTVPTGAGSALAFGAVANYTGN
jgi:hypothetical protein